MSRSVVNDANTMKKQLYLDNKQKSFISLYQRNQVNKKFQELIKTIKNNFGVVVCIGSNGFYSYTRQMLLHLDYNKAINLAQEQTLQQNLLQLYKSQRLSNSHIDIQIISPKNKQPYTQNHKKPRKQSIDAQQQIQTSFAINKQNQDDVHHILENQIYQIESEYQQSHNQLNQKDMQTTLPFKKTNSSVVIDVNPKIINEKSQKISSRKNIFLKNLETESQDKNNCLNKSPKRYSNENKESLGDENFHKDVQVFKSSLQKRKIQQFMKKNGLSKVSVRGQQKFVWKNDFLRVYNNKEIGTDKEKKPIEWLYCEVKQTNEINDAIVASYLVGSTIIYELPFDKQPTKQELQKQIKKYFQFYRKFQAQINRFDDSNSDMPEIVLICPIDQEQNAQTQKTAFRAVFNQLQSFYIPQNKKTVSYYQSPCSQYQLSPSKSKLPPTPKRIPISHRPPLHDSSTNIPSKNNQGVKKKVRLQFRFTSQQLAKSGVLRQNYSRMRQITTLGRDIFSEQNLKTLGGNWVQSECFNLLLSKLSSEMPKINVKDFYQTWDLIFSDYLKINMEDAVHKYQQKVNQLLVGKSMISKSRLQQVHQAVKRQTLRQFSQKKIGNSRVLIPSIKGIPSGIKLVGSSQNIVPPSSHNRKMSISRKLVQSRRQLFLAPSSNDPTSNNIYQTDGSLDEQNMEQQQLLNLVQSRIQSLKQQIQLKNKNQSLKWTRKFLQNEYEAIKKKLLLTKEVKSLNGYKNQFEGLRERFRKKLQNYSASQQPQLIEVLQNFVFQKIWDGVQTLMQKQRSQWKQKLKKQSSKIQQLQNQIKQLKKSFFLKQRSLTQLASQKQNTFQQLQHSFTQIQSQLTIKTKQISYLKLQHQQKLTQLSQKYQASIKQYKTQIQNLKAQQLKKQQNLLYLQSELQKQQLLHKQTHDNYEQILVNYKNNIGQLERKIKEIKEVRNLEEEERMRSMSGVGEEDGKKKEVEKDERIEYLEKELQIKQSEIQELNTQYRTQKDIIQKNQGQLEQKNNQLQVQYKLLEEKYIELQSRLVRYKSNQTAAQRLQKEKQQLVKKINAMVNSQAIQEQHLKQKQEQIEQLKAKIKSNEVKFIQSQNIISQQLSQIKKQNQEVKKKVRCLEKQTNNAFIQTEVTLNSKCKNCKQNMIKLNQAMILIEELNKNYEGIKAMHLTQRQFMSSTNNNSGNLTSSMNIKNRMNDNRNNLYHSDNYGYINNETNERKILGSRVVHENNLYSRK